MSSGFQYLPKPPRVWSRVQNRCSTNTDNSSLVYVPLSNEYMPQADANYKTQMYVKGNVLQYKKNSSSLTKQQKYSLISKGMWVGKKSYATQSETYTNPNTTSLLRVNYSNIPFPNVIVGYPNNISGPFQYNVANPFDCSTNLLQDGGNLVCNAVVSPCTGEVTQTFTEQQCFPTTCSNVPGPITDLCWNPKIQTWYPKNRTTMNNSGTKWPDNYKGFVSAVKPEPPTLLTIYGGCGTISLTWSYIESACIPVSNFYIFANDVLVEILSYEYTSTTLTGLSFNTTYSVYIKSVSNTTLSEKSNTLTTTTLPLPSAPSNLTGSAGCGFIDISWDAGTGVCLYYYNIYLNGSLYESISSSLTSTTIYNLNYNTTYSIYVKSGSSASGSGESGESNVISLTTLSLPTITLSATNNYKSIYLSWVISGTCTSLISSYNIYLNNVLYSNVSSSTTSINITGLNVDTSYNCLIESVISSSIIITSNEVNVYLNSLYFTSLTPTIDISNNYYILTFDTSGTITFYYDYTITLIAVGGGGGGGGEIYSNPGGNLTLDIKYGAGGGGGGIGLLGLDISANTPYTITIGNYGTQGSETTAGGNGSYTEFTDGTYNLTATGGTGGARTTFIGAEGMSNTTFTNYIFFTGYTGGNGGRGAEYYSDNPFAPPVINDPANNGGDSTTLAMPINVNGFQFSYSGGGAGGSNVYGTDATGGGAGNAGVGGIIRTTQGPGGNAYDASSSSILTTYGSGGGGGGYFLSSPQDNTIGGYGAPGVLIIIYYDAS